jgi:monofunctional biosynthetic peptidoglycan transglycosylase
MAGAAGKLPPMAEQAAGRRRGATVWRRAKRALLLALAGFLTLSVGLVVLYRFLPPPLTPLMVIRLAEGEGLAKDWVAYDDISPNVFKAVIAAEDTRFCQHAGFDLKAIQAAFDRNKKGRRLLGASTISMQTAKNVFLWPGRDWLRKGLEAYFTALIELVWDKRRILEVYVNVIEFGPGLYGIEAAAQHYYKKPASALAAGEAARLASVLPNPRAWTPHRLPRNTKLPRVRAEMREQPPPLDARCPVGPYAER